MKIHWTQTAQAHLAAIHQYIAQDSPHYAGQMVDRLTRRSQQIGAFPQSGRKVPEYESDELREVVEGPYRIIYRITPGQLDVIAVIHGARDLPAAAREDGWAEASDTPEKP
ncbi:MAG: hypothetical protein BIFFINMI_03759 [Phycisphaerae bacterium]|nr:hypothetical protein [Phycisphaerae bacterium]